MGLAVAGLFCSLIVGSLLFSGTKKDPGPTQPSSPAAALPASSGAEIAVPKPRPDVDPTDPASPLVEPVRPEPTVKEELAGLEDEEPDALTDAPVEGRA